MFRFRFAIMQTARYRVSHSAPYSLVNPTRVLIDGIRINRLPLTSTKNPPLRV